MQEHDFLRPAYECPFVFRGSVYTDIDGMVVSECAPDGLCAKVQGEAYRLLGTTTPLECSRSSLTRGYCMYRLAGIYARFTQNPLMHRLRCLPTWPGGQNLPELSPVEERLLHSMYDAYKYLDTQMQSWPVSLDIEPEILSTGASPLGLMVMDRIMPALGVRAYDPSVREVVVLGAWELDEGHILVCSFTRPKLSSCLLGIRNTPISHVEQIVDNAMDRISPHVMLDLNRPKVQSFRGGIQVMGCGGQFAYAELEELGVTISTVNTAGSEIVYTIFDSDGAATVYSPTGATNMILGRYIPHSKYNPVQGALDVHTPDARQSFKLHVTSTGRISSVTGLDYVGRVYASLKQGINDMMAGVSAAQVLNTLTPATTGQVVEDGDSAPRL